RDVLHRRISRSADRRVHRCQVQRAARPCVHRDEGGVVPADLTTTYLGLTLGCPLVASSSPLTGKLESLRAIADHGPGAVVLPALLEEEAVGGDEPSSESLGPGEEHPGEAAGYMTTVDRGHLDAYLDLVREAKRELEIPVIASLNGATPGGWTRTAELL